MKNNKKKEYENIYKLYKKYLRENPNLLRIMGNFNIDEKTYLDALYSMEGSRIVTKKPYSDTTF